jgi:hypothetical protein
MFPIYQANPDFHPFRPTAGQLDSPKTVKKRTTEPKTDTNRTIVNWGGVRGAKEAQFQYHPTLVNFKADRGKKKAKASGKTTGLSGLKVRLWSQESYRVSEPAAECPRQTIKIESLGDNPF